MATKNKITSQFMNADQLREMLGVSKAKAYMIIRDLNAEMEEQGYLVLAGRVNKRYLFDRLGVEGNYDS